MTDTLHPWVRDALIPQYDLSRGEVGSLRHTSTEPHTDEPRIAWCGRTGSVTYKGLPLGMAFAGSADRAWGIHVEYRGASLIRGDIESLGSLWLLLKLFVSEQIVKDAAE